MEKRRHRKAEPGDTPFSVSFGALLKAILSSLCACPSSGLADHEKEDTGSRSVPSYQHLLPHDREASELP